MSRLDYYAAAVFFLLVGKARAILNRIGRSRRQFRRQARYWKQSPQRISTKFIREVGMLYIQKNTLSELTCCVCFSPWFALCPPFLL